MTCSSLLLSNANAVIPGGEMSPKFVNHDCPCISTCQNVATITVHLQTSVGITAPSCHHIKMVQSSSLVFKRGFIFTTYPEAHTQTITHTNKRILHPFSSKRKKVTVGKFTKSHYVDCQCSNLTFLSTRQQD